VTLAPPRPPSADELEALIREVRARQRKRWLGTAAVIALLAGAVLGLNSIVTGGSPNTSGRSAEPRMAVRSGEACGVRVDDMRIVGSGGRTLFREPGDWTPSYAHPSVVRCSGSTAWVVWDNGAAMNQEGYVGAGSADGGRTWHLVFGDAFFGIKVPHELDPYLGPWALGGPRVAYFTGWCPSCSPRPLVSLWVTRDRGRSFEKYPVAALAGYQPTGLRVAGHRATISGRRAMLGVPPNKTATFRIP
jgi:hypothetical protein